LERKKKHENLQLQNPFRPWITNDWLKTKNIFVRLFNFIRKPWKGKTKHRILSDVVFHFKELLQL